MNTGDRIIIANCSGFLGDRMSAAGEMVRGGPIDVLTGDYLAELTMAILLKKKMKDPAGGYVSTFLKQMEDILAECLEKKIKIVSNAGGLNPAGLAEELRKMADKAGLKPKISYITGDDIMPNLKELMEGGEEFVHMDRGESLRHAKARPISANAYLGGWGIARALDAGADIVVGGRLADAALVMGPAAWRFGWREDDWDRLAGAAAAGHIIECGTQATGGNYSFMDEVPSYINMGFPIAEICSDGSSVITKHPGTGGLVSAGTVKAQLLYEIRGPEYITPDVTARFDTIEISEEGRDRVAVRGAMGSPPPSTAKVCINVMGGFRNSMTVILTGLDIEKKAAVVEETLFDSLGGRDTFDAADVSLVRCDREDARSNEEAFAYLRITLIDPDGERVGRIFSGKVVELALSSIPGFTLAGPPSGSSPSVKYWPALISNRHINQRIFMDGNEIAVVAPKIFESIKKFIPAGMEYPAIMKGRTVRAPFGYLFGTRSGDKGGNANLGVWAVTPESYGFLLGFLTMEKFMELVPDAGGFEIERYEFRNLLALNFYIKGILGDGASASVRSDPQAKTLGEYLRSRIIDLPVELYDSWKRGR